MDQQIKPWTSSESFILYTKFPIRWHNQDSVDFFAVELFMFFFYLRDIYLTYTQFNPQKFCTLFYNLQAAELLSVAKRIYKQKSDFTFSNNHKPFLIICFGSIFYCVGRKHFIYTKKVN